MNNEEVLSKYISLINNNILSLLPLKAVDVKQNLYKMNCLRDNSHEVYYDTTTHIFSCPICGYQLSLIELTSEIMEISQEETIQKILIQKLKKKPNEIQDLEDLLLKKQERIELYYKANQRALELFKENLKYSDKAKDYIFNKRKLSVETVENFCIGYAPCDNNFLTILSKEFPLEILYGAGLLGQNEKTKQYYDFFHDRVMFPVFDCQGRVIAFGGRTMGSSPKKYLNTRTTPIFSKSTVLYAMDKLLTHRRYEVVLVCEGYMDVVSMYQKGIYNVVGNLGTAITKKHLKLLAKYTNKPVVMLDGDSAGTQAMNRTIEKVGKVHTVVLPDSLDPDEYLKIHTKEDLISYIKSYMKSWDEVVKEKIIVLEGNLFKNLFEIKQF